MNDVVLIGSQTANMTADYVIGTNVLDFAVRHPAVLSELILRYIIGLLFHTFINLTNLVSNC